MCITYIILLYIIIYKEKQQKVLMKYNLYYLFVSFTRTTYRYIACHSVRINYKFGIIDNP